VKLWLRVWCLVFFWLTLLANQPISDGEATEYDIRHDTLWVNCPGNPWSQSGRRKGRLLREGLAEKKGFKPGWNNEEVTDDKSSESMELMEEVPLKRLGESELERLVRGWRREAGSWFQKKRIGPYFNLLYDVRQTSVYCSVLLTVILTDVMSVVSPAAWVENSRCVRFTNCRNPVVGRVVG